MATDFSSSLRAHSPSLLSRLPPGAKLSAAHSPLKGCPIDFTPSVIAAEYSSSLPGSQLQEGLQYACHILPTDPASPLHLRSRHSEEDETWQPTMVTRFHPRCLLCSWPWPRDPFLSEAQNGRFTLAQECHIDDCGMTKATGLSRTPLSPTLTAASGGVSSLLFWGGVW